MSRCAVVGFRAQKGLKTEEGVEKLFADPVRELPAEPDNNIPNPTPGNDDVYVGSGRYIKVSGLLAPFTPLASTACQPSFSSHPCVGATDSTD
jgi:hypothetical protein